MTTTSKVYGNYVVFVESKALRRRSKQEYLRQVRKLGMRHQERSLKQISERMLLDHLIHLRDKEKLRPSTLNQAVVALRMFYHDYLSDWQLWAPHPKCFPDWKAFDTDDVEGSTNRRAQRQRKLEAADLVARRYDYCWIAGTPCAKLNRNWVETTLSAIARHHRKCLALASSTQTREAKSLDMQFLFS